MASIWQRIFNSTETRATTPATVPPRSTTLASPESALSLTAVWRSVQILATSVSNLGWQTKRYATGIEIVIDNPTFINNPSLIQTRHQFLYATVSEMALTGNAFWFKNLDSQGRVNDVTLIPSSAMSVTLAEPNNLFSARVYNYMGKQYSADLVEHLQLFPRAGWLKAPSPIQICGDDIVAALDLRDFQANWFSSAAVPTGVLKTGREISPDDAAEITTNWHAKQSQRQIAVLGNGFEYQATALKPSEAMFTEVSAQSVQGIARLFGIPARKLVTGVDGTSDTYSNLTDEESAFFRETLQAYTRPLQDALSRCLPRGSRVEPLWEDLILSKSARIEMWAKAIQAGIVTPQYAAEKEGFNA